jgi:hypothetical protein
MQLIEPFLPSPSSAFMPFQRVSFSVARVELSESFGGWTAEWHALVDAVRDGTQQDERVLFDAPSASRERVWSKHFAAVVPVGERAGRVRPPPTVRP